MRMELKDCNKSQSVFEFAQENTVTGNISFKLYGHQADNLINRKERIPYICKEGKFCWNVSTKEVTIHDIICTFHLSKDGVIEFDEAQNSENYESDTSMLRTTFYKYLKPSVKEWRPKAGLIKMKPLMKYIKATGVSPEFVLDAIWAQDSYTADGFSELFSVSRNHAISILEVAGYQRKNCEKDYYLVDHRKDSVRNCLEQSRLACHSVDDRTYAYVRVKQSICNRIVNIGMSISDFGEKKGYFNNNVSDWVEPAYSKRKDAIEKVLSSVTVVLMFMFVASIIIAFISSMSKFGDELSDSLYSFWGSIAGSMVAGLVTIFTTWLIIRRSYKIDYHQERMAALPFFELNIIAADFSIDDTEELPEGVENAIDNHMCFCDQSLERAMLLEIINTGRGPAFQVTVQGVTEFYEEPALQSLAQGKNRHIVVVNRKQAECKLSFYDIYGNYYYHVFNLECMDNGHICVNTVPPELVLRTNRIRYKQ